MNDTHKELSNNNTTNTTNKDNYKQNLYKSKGFFKLVEKAQKGDKDSFQHLYQMYHSYIISHSYYKNRFDEDLKQELSKVFCELVLKTHLVADDCYMHSSFTEFVCNTMTNRKKDYIENLLDLKDKEISMLSWEYSEIFPDDIIDFEAEELLTKSLPTLEQIEKRELFSELQKLSKQDLLIFLHKAINEFTHAEIADELGINIETIRKKFERTKKVFKNNMQRKHDEIKV